MVDIENTIYNKLCIGDIQASRDPISIIFCGAPGSGKSSVKDVLIRDKGISNYINLDPDLLRLQLINLGISPDKAVSLQTNYNMKFVITAIRDRINIIYDTTCRVIGQTQYIVDMLHRSNYKIIFVSVYASLNKSLERVEKRGIEQLHRSIPREHIIDMYNEVYSKMSYYLANANVKKMDDKISELRLYINDNNNNAPILVYNRIENKVVMCKDVDIFYDVEIKCPNLVRRN